MLVNTQVKSISVQSNNLITTPHCAQPLSVVPTEKLKKDSKENTTDIYGRSSTPAPGTLPPLFSHTHTETKLTYAQVGCSSQVRALVIHIHHSHTHPIISSSYAMICNFPQNTICRTILRKHVVHGAHCSYD